MTRKATDNPPVQIRIAFSLAVLLAVPGLAHAQIQAATFNPGIYYRLPNLVNPAGRLARLDDPLFPNVLSVMPPFGWDRCGDQVVVPAPDQGLAIVSAAGVRRVVPITGIYRYGRPSFSPDCRRVAVQASATPGIENGAEDLNIYVVDVDTAAIIRVGDLSSNEESPRFFPVGSRLAYSSFSQNDGVNLHVWDFDQNREVLLTRDIGALQIGISPSGDRIIDPRTMKIYDATTGTVVMNLLSDLLATLPGTGFSLDERFKDVPGQPNRGLYPLDASYSPDGTEVVLDWALRQGDRYGNVLLRLSIDARQLRVISDLIPQNPDLSNRNNFSQLNPVWK